MFKRFVARVLIFFQIYSSLFQSIAYGGYGLLENLPIQDEIYLHGGYAKDGGLRLSLWTSTLTSQKTELLKEIEIPTYEEVKARSRTNSRASSPSPALQLPTSNLSPPSIADSFPSQTPPSSFSPLPDAQQPTEIFSDQDSVLAALTDQEDMSDEENSAFESEEGILRTPEGAHFNIQGLKVFLSNSGELLVQGKQEDFSHPILLSSDRSIILHEVEAFALKLTSGSIISVGESKIDFLSLEGSADDGTIMPQFLNQGSLSAKAIFLKNLNNANNGRLTTDTIEIPEGVFENLGNLRVKEQMTLNAERFTNRGTAAISTLHVLDSVRRLENAENAELEFTQPVYLPPSTATVNEGFMKGSIQSQGTIFNQGFLEGDFLKTSEALTNRGILRSRTIEADGPSFEQTGTITARRLQIGHDTHIITSATQKLELTEAIESHSQSPWTLDGKVTTPTFSHLGRLELLGELITEQFEGHGIINERGRLKAQESRFTDATTILGRATLQHLDGSGDVIVQGIVTVRDQATIGGRLYVRENGMLKGKKTKPLTLTLQDGGEIAGLVDVDYLSATKPLTLAAKGKLVSRVRTNLFADLLIPAEASAELHYLSSHSKLENHGDLTIIGVRPGSQLNLVNNGIAHVDALQLSSKANGIMPENTVSSLSDHKLVDPEFKTLTHASAKLSATFYKKLLMPTTDGNVDSEFTTATHAAAKRKGSQYKQQFLDLARGTSLEELEADYQALHKRLYAATHTDSDGDTASQKFGSITPINFSGFETLPFSQLVDQLKKNALDYALPLPTDIEKRSYTYLENLARHQQNVISHLQQQYSIYIGLRAYTTDINEIMRNYKPNQAKISLIEIYKILGKSQEEIDDVWNPKKLSGHQAKIKFYSNIEISLKRYITEHPELVQKAWAETSEQSPVYLDKILDIESPNGKNLAQLRAAGIGYYRKAGLLTPEKYAEFKEKNLAQMRAAAIHAAKAYREKALQDNPYLLQQARDNALIVADEQLMQQEIEKLLPQKFQRNYIRRLSIHDTRDLAIESSKLLGKAEEEIKLLRRKNVYDMHDKLIELQNELKPKYVADHPEIIMQAREATRTAVQYLKRLGQQIAAYKNLATEIFKVNLQAVNHPTGQLTLKSGRFDFTDAGAFVNEGTLVQEQAAVHWLAKASEDFNTGTWRVKGSLQLDNYRSENLGVLEVDGILRVTTPDDAMEAFKGLAKVKTQRLVMHAPSLKDVTPEDKILPWVLELHLAQDFETKAKMTTGPLELFCKGFKPGGKLFTQQLDLVSQLADLNIDSIVFGRDYIRLATDRLSIDGRVVLPGKACPNILYTRSGSGFHSEGPVMLDVKEHWRNYYGTISASYYQLTGPSLTNIAGYIEGRDETQKSFLRMARIEHARDAQGSYHVQKLERRTYGRHNKCTQCDSNCNSPYGYAMHDYGGSATCETSDEAVITHKGDLELVYDSLDVMVSQITSAKALTFTAQGHVKEIGDAFDHHLGTRSQERNGKKPQIRSRHFQGDLGSTLLAGTLRAESVAIMAANMTLQNMQLPSAQKGAVVRIVEQLMRPGHSKLYELTDAGYDTVIPWAQKQVPHSIALVGKDAESLPETFGTQFTFRALENIMGPLFLDLYRGVSYLGLSLDLLMAQAVEFVRVQKGTTTTIHRIQDGDTTREIEVVKNPDITMEDLKKSGIPMVLMEFVKNLNRVEDDLKATKYAEDLKKIAVEACAIFPAEKDARSGIFAEKAPANIDITEGNFTSIGSVVSAHGGFINVPNGRADFLAHAVTVGDANNYYQVLNRPEIENLGVKSEGEEDVFKLETRDGISLEGAILTAADKDSLLDIETQGMYDDQAAYIQSRQTTFSSTKKTSTTTIIDRSIAQSSEYNGEGMVAVKSSMGIVMQAPTLNTTTNLLAPSVAFTEAHDAISVQTITEKKGKRKWYGASGASKTTQESMRSWLSKGAKIKGKLNVHTGKAHCVNPTISRGAEVVIHASEAIDIAAGVNQSDYQMQSTYKGAVWNKQRMTQESRTTHVNPRIDGDVYFYTPKARVQQRAGSGPIANITSDVPIDYVDMIDQHHYTSKSQKSLSAGAAMIVRLGVALLVANPFAGGGLSSTMAGAGFDTLCSETAINMIENDGNPGRALQAMREKNIVKTVARSVAAAGLTGALGAGTAPTSVEGFAKEFLARSAVSTTMAIAFDGVKPGDAIRQGALNAAVQTVGACIANKIGDMASAKMGTEQIGNITQEIFHGFLGAGIGAGTAAIMGQDIGKGATSGAIGAVVGHSTAKISGSKELGNLVAVAVAMMTDQDVGIAYMASNNATTYNYAAHQSKATPEAKDDEKEDEEVKEHTQEEAREGFLEGLREGAMTPRTLAKYEALKSYDALQQTTLGSAYVSRHERDGLNPEGVAQAAYEHAEREIAFKAIWKDFKGEEITPYEREVRNDFLIAQGISVALNRVGIPVAASTIKKPVAKLIAKTVKSSHLKMPKAAEMEILYTPQAKINSGFLQFNAKASAITKKAMNPHGNSLQYAGNTHVYAIRDAEGNLYKIGESMKGTNAFGLSRRAEAQAQKIFKQTGSLPTSEIRRVFSSKAEARAWETGVIERYRKLFGKDLLPGNKGNR